MARVVLLLRGLNVGRNRRVPMADLHELLEEAGYPEPRTLLQSGNVVLESPTGAEKTVAQRFELASKELYVCLGTVRWIPR